MAYNLEDGTPSFVIEVDFLKGEKGDTGFSPRIEIASLTSAEYILKVINEDGEFLTPNLKSDLSLDDYVLKEEGKGLSTNSFENEEKQKLQELHNYDDTEIRSQVSGLAESIGKINSFDVKVVDELPTENIDVHTIYFVPNEQDDDNYYDEFLYVNSRWEHIGTSKVDLSNYATLQQIEELRQGQEELNQAQQELIDDLGKTYKDTNITAPTVAGYGRIKKLYGQTVETLYSEVPGITIDKSPEYPSTLKCIGDDVNLFDMNWLSTRVLPSVFTTLVNNKPITLEAGTYTFSNILDDGSYLNAQYMSVEYRDADGVSVLNSTVNGSFEITEEQASKIATIQVNYNAAAYVGKTIKEMKLQKGSTKTPYSPYGYGTVENISTDGTNTSSNVVYVDKPLCSIGDIRDEIDYTNKKITRKYGYAIFDGSDDENWAFDSGYNRFYIDKPFDTPISISDNKSLCSRYKNGNSETIDDSFNLGTKQILIKDESFTDLASFKEFLAENPITFIVPLTTPTTEYIDCSDKIVQYADSTTVHNRDGAEIEVELTNNDTISGLNEVDKVLDKKIEEVKAKHEEMNTYSTEEQVVGTWIDGKPIYRQFFSGTSFFESATVYIATLRRDVDRLVRAEGYRDYGDSGAVPSNDVRTAGNELRFQYAKSEGTIPGYYAIVEYTKTTD